MRFLTDEPQWTHPHQEMALDMARFEWAEVVAFDGPAKPAITAADLAGKDPARLRLGLQPYLTLLDMAYPLDDFSLALKTQGMRSEASNAVDESRAAGPSRSIRRPRRKRTFVAVHRLDNDLYYKRLAPAGYRILTALRDGRTLAGACESAPDPTPEEIRGKDGKQTAPPAVSPQVVGEWFAEWMSLGWFCKPGRG